MSPQVEGDVFNGEFAGLDFGIVQNIVDDAEERFAGMFQRFQIALLLSGQLGVEQEGRYADHPVHRGTDFVAHGRQGVGLRLAGPHGLVAGFRDLPVLPFEVLGRFRQRAFCAFSHGDVDDGCQRQFPVRRIDRVESELDGKLLPVLMQAEEFPAGSHGAGRRGGEVSDAMRRMVGTKPFRNQHFDRLAEHLLSAVAEHGFDLFVDERDVAEGIDHQHAVRRGFHHLTELGLGLFARGDVAYDTGKLSDAVDEHLTHGQLNGK